MIEPFGAFYNTKWNLLAMADAATELEPWKIALGQRLIAARGGLTQAALAELIGVVPKTVRSYEQGVRLPDAAYLIRFQEVTSVNLNWLLSGQGGMRGRNVLSDEEWREVGHSLLEVIAREDTSTQRRASILHNYLQNLLDAKP